ncbi:Uncharacterised protein [Buttiauxella agrestis]|uniref:Uncharacterized protein n=1 Tax=Buttiauxella agrestis TaxID=82977 RepID=A0A381KQK6_9ENTR|nr:Uncharacterised protein [Buttiauxella agrestis]
MGFRGFLNWTIGLVRNNKSLDEYDEDLLISVLVTKTLCRPILM